MKDENAAAGIGHNGREATDAALLSKWHPILCNIEAELAAVRERRNKLRKQAKAEGVMLGQYDAFVKVGMWTRDEQAEHLETLASYAKFFRLPVGTQLALFADVEPEPDGERGLCEAAWADGWRAGLAGLDDDENPHTAEHAVGQEWIRGWQEGSAQRARALKMGPDEPAIPAPPEDMEDD